MNRIILSLAMLAGAVLAGAAGAASTGLNGRVILLDDGWQYHYGDPPAAGSVSWRAAGRLNSPPGRAGEEILWFRHVLPAEAVSGDALYLPVAFISYEVFVGGALLFRADNFGRGSRRELPGSTWRIIPLPRDPAGRELLVRVYSDYSGIGFFGTPRIGSPAAIVARMARVDLPKLVLAAIFFLLGALSLALLATRMRHVLFLGFGLMLVCGAAYVIIHTDAIILFLDAPRFWSHAWLVTNMLIPVGGTLFFMNIAGRRYRRLLSAFLCVFIAFAIGGSFVLAFRPVPPLGIRTPLYILYFVAFAVIIAIALREAARRNTEARIFLAGFMFLLAIGLYETLIVFFPALRLFPSVLYAGIAGFVASTVAIMLRRFFRMRDEMGRYRSRLAELELARAIQRSVLPGDPPAVRGIACRALYVPMKEVGGDFYGFHPVGEDALGVLIADVSGHGVPAALITTMIKVAFSSARDRAREPGPFMERLRGMLLPDCGEQFITAGYAYLDAGAGLLRYASAGHLPAILLGKGEAGIREIGSPGPMIGLLGAGEYGHCEERLAAGDRVVLCTDGFIECRNAMDEIYGFDRFYATLAMNRDLPPDGFIEAVYAAAVAWAGDDSQMGDDLTMVVVDVE